jgi:tetratricopeptide (TPR) repeat protein
MRKIFTFGALCIFSLCMRIYSVDFSIRPRGFVSIPYGESAGLFTPGGGGDLIFDIDISSILTNPLLLGYSLAPELGYNYVPLLGAGEGMHLASAALGASFFYYPLSRMNLRIGGALGFYEAFFNQNTYLNTWWKFSGEMGFRFSPSFILSLNGGYRSYSYKPGEPLYTGFFTGLTAQILIETGNSANTVSVALQQDEPIFPVFLGLYRENPAGVLRITNNESAEIRNITVSFRAGNYTASQFLCGNIPRLGKRRTAEIPLYADFSSLVFNFSENGRIPGEVVVRYELLGKERVSAQSVVVSVFNRNSFRWDDAAALAVFISPTAPEVLDYTKYIIGLIRNRLRTGLNQNMQFAIALFEGLRLGGIGYSNDQETSYVNYHQDPAEVDYIQFPFQTLAYRSGDLDDLGLLYAATLEAANIKTALIPLPDDFVVAFSLGISEYDAGIFFDSLDNLLIIEDEAWMAVSFAAFREGFTNCWYNAMNNLNYIFNSGAAPEFIILQNAWASYPPAAISAQEAQFDKPAEDGVFRAVETNMMRYISSEFSPKITAVFNRIRTEGGSPALYNQLGLLYVRAGMYAEAKAEYQRSAAMNNLTAMVNLGNLAVLENDWDAAETWYRRVLQLAPDNQAAINGLNRIAIDRLDS